MTNEQSVTRSAGPGRPGAAPPTAVPTIRRPGEEIANRPQLRVKTRAEDGHSSRKRFACSAMARFNAWPTGKPPAASSSAGAITSARRIVPNRSRTAIHVAGAEGTTAPRKPSPGMTSSTPSSRKRSIVAAAD